MASELVDFDAWYAENVAPTITLRAAGRDWEVPADLPAATLLRLQRIERTVMTALDPDAPAEELDLPEGITLDDLSFEGMTRLMVGDELADAWIEAGITGRLLSALTSRLYAYYSGKALTLTTPPTDPPEETVETVETTESTPES